VRVAGCLGTAPSGGLNIYRYFSVICWASRVLSLYRFFFKPFRLVILRVYPAESNIEPFFLD
jgi:hypothetical protein